MNIRALFILVGLTATSVFAQQTATPTPAQTARRQQAQQGQQRVKDLYNKFEYMIPMRDGVKLYCSVYVPKSADGHSPIMLERTPYSAGPYGPDAYKGGFRGSQKMSDAGYIFAAEDVRGRYMSEGQFVEIRPEGAARYHPTDIDESTDTYDTIDYLIKNVPGNNHRVGMWGISYPGFYTAAGTINSHPALKAASPQAPVSEWFLGDDFHHNGVFFVEDAFNFESGFGQPRPVPTATPARGPQIDRGADGEYAFFLGVGPLHNLNDRYLHDNVAFWGDMMNHGSYDDFWRRRSLEPNLKGIKCAVMTVGGEFHAEDCYGATHVYQAIEKQNPGIANSLVFGPWFHGGWAGGTGATFGDIDFGSPASQWYRDEVEFPFFDHNLRPEANTAADIPEALVFETGANKWDRFSQWPPKVAKTAVYLSESNTLSFQKPKAAPGTSDSYIADPAHPVNYTAEPVRRRPREYMIADQRFNENKPDVLAYKSEPLDHDVTIAGPIKANLFASTTGTDADFVVKVIDVFPPDSPANHAGKDMANYEMLVRGDIMRGKFRNSFSKPEPFVPGKVSRVQFTLQDVCHTFKKGHRMMVQVQSSWFPLADLNPNKFVDIYHAVDADFQKATINIERSAKYPSNIEVGVLSGT